MSKKIIINEATRAEIIDFVKNTYQCTISDISEHFNLSKHAIYNNFEKSELNSMLFHGCKDSTKEKLKLANLGKVQSEESNKKRSESVKASFAKRTKESWEKSYELSRNTKIEKYGSWENYSKYWLEKSKATKLERYGDENYNNVDKGKATKLERYGDENYNNKDKIKETQFKLYGNYAFCDRIKYEATMMEKYGVTHNWASTDPKLNGRETMYNLYGSGDKDNYYQYCAQKTKETCLDKYGVSCYLQTPECREKVKSAETQQKRINTLRENDSFEFSGPELEIRQLLYNKYGEDNVFFEYQDARYINPDTGYKFKCDFYIKSIDTFIELNLFPTHGGHAYNSENEEDAQYKAFLENNYSKWNDIYLFVWCYLDPLKLKVAKNNNLHLIIIYPDEYDLFKLALESDNYDDI